MQEETFNGAGVLGIEKLPLTLLIAVNNQFKASP